MQTLDQYLERNKPEIVALAKQLLMRRRRWTEAQAHRWLQCRAMDQRVPLAVLANRVLATA